MRARLAMSGFDPRRPHHWIAFGLGSGLSPWAPGTAGTLVAVPIYMSIANLPLGWYLAVLALVCAVGFWACGRTARDLGEDDPSAIVWDEVAGYLVAMTAAPRGWAWVLAGFLAFRLFDIVKPWPIRAAERLRPPGLGIMIDDLVAGVFAWATLWVAARWLGL
jgi:phosphatidylglycerophosphatase A